MKPFRDLETNYVRKQTEKSESTYYDLRVGFTRAMFIWVRGIILFHSVCLSQQQTDLPNDLTIIIDFRAMTIL